MKIGNHVMVNGSVHVFRTGVIDTWPNGLLHPEGFVMVRFMSKRGTPLVRNNAEGQPPVDVLNVRRLNDFGEPPPRVHRQASAQPSAGN